MGRDFTLDRIIYWLFRTRMPFTNTVILFSVLSFFIIGFGNLVGVVELLTFNSAKAILQPWTLFTYALVWEPNVKALLSVVFAAYWMWVVGGSLERSWGMSKFATFFFTIAALSALGLFIGSFTTGNMLQASGLWLPLAGLTVAFGMLNPEQQILFWFVIPLKLKYLALIVVIFTAFSFLRHGPITAMLALTGCAYGYWYVTAGRQYGYRASGRPAGGETIRLFHRPSLLQRLNPLRWYREYKDRKRLRKFLDR